MKDQPVNRGGIYARYFLKPQTERKVASIEVKVPPGLELSVTEFSTKRRSSTSGWEDVPEMSLPKLVTKTALPKVGRPRKASKLTAAEKQRAYRERKKHG